MNVTRHVAEVGDAALYLDPGRLPVFRGLSFGLGAGERLAVIGSNGAGKTLLLKSIAGILRLDEGTARVRAESGMVDPRWVPEAVAYISLGSGFHPFLTIREAVTLAGRLVRRWDASLESELTHGFRINVERKCGTLSQGECILLQIVIALCRRPRLVLIDDGLAVLHPENTEFFFKVINRPAFREMGLIFATQNFGLVSTFATAALDLNLAAAADGAGRSSAAVAPRLASQPGEPGLATPCRAEPGLMEPASMKPGSMESRSMVFLRIVGALARNDFRAMGLAVLAAWIVAALAEAAALLGVMDRLGSFGPGVAVVAQLMIALGGSAENWLKDPLWDNSHWVVRLGVRREAMAAARTVANLALFVLPLAVTLLAAEGGGGVLRNTGDLAWPLAAVVVLAPLPAMFFRRLWQVIALDIAALMAFSLVFADAHERPVWRWDRGWWPAPAAIGILLGLTCLAAAQRTRIRAVLVLSAGLAALAAVTFRMKAY